MRWIENTPGLFKCQTPVWVWAMCKFCLVFPRSVRDEVAGILVGDPVFHTICHSFGDLEFVRYFLQRKPW